MTETLAHMIQKQHDERMRLVRWHRQNACKRQGLPYEDVPEPQDLKVNIDTTELRKTIDELKQIQSRPAQTQTPLSPISQTSATPQPSLLSKALPWALAALAGGGSVGLWQWVNKKPDPTVIEQPGDSSLLQWLEDQGQHMPRQ